MSAHEGAAAPGWGGRQRVLGAVCLPAARVLTGWHSSQAGVQAGHPKLAWAPCGKHTGSDFSLCAPSLLPILSTCKAPNFSHFPEAQLSPRITSLGPHSQRLAALSLCPAKRERKPAEAPRIGRGVSPEPAGAGDPQVWSRLPRPHFPQMRISFRGPDVFPRQMLHLGSSPGTPAERKAPCVVSLGSWE